MNRNSALTLVLLLSACSSYEPPYYRQDYDILDQGMVIGVTPSNSHFVGIDFDNIVTKIVSITALSAVASSHGEIIDKQLKNAVDRAFDGINRDLLTPKSGYTYKIKLASGGFKNVSRETQTLNAGECVEFVNMENRELVVGAGSCNGFWEALNIKLHEYHDASPSQSNTAL